MTYEADHWLLCDRKLVEEFEWNNCWGNAVKDIGENSKRHKEALKSHADTPPRPYS